MLLSLLVAWRSRASLASSGDMPEPSSVTTIRAGTATLNLDPQPRGAGIDRVLDQLLHHRGRSLHDLARGDLIDQRVREPPHRMSFLRAFSAYLWQSRHSFTSSDGISWGVR